MNPLPDLLSPAILTDSPALKNSDVISATFDTLFAVVLAAIEPASATAGSGPARKVLPRDGNPLPDMPAEQQTLVSPIPADEALSKPATESSTAQPDDGLIPIGPDLILAALAAQPGPPLPPNTAAAADVSDQHGLEHPAPLPVIRTPAQPPQGARIETTALAAEQPADPATSAPHNPAERIALAIDPGANAVALSAVVPDVAEMRPSGAPGSFQHIPASQGTTGFAAIVERIVAAREASGDAPVSIAVRNRDFGVITLRFEPREHGIAVTATSADPEFARAVAAAAPSERSGWQADAEPRSLQQPGAQHDQQRAAQPHLNARPNRNPSRDAGGSDLFAEPSQHRHAGGLFA